MAYLKDVQYRFLKMRSYTPCTSPPHLVGVYWADITRQQLEKVDSDYCNNVVNGK